MADSSIARRRKDTPPSPTAADVNRVGVEFNVAIGAKIFKQADGMRRCRARQLPVVVIRSQARFAVLQSLADSNQRSSHATRVGVGVSSPILWRPIGPGSKWLETGAVAAVVP